MAPLVVHLDVNVCVFVPERGKGERVQCRNQLLAELFMGRCFGPSNLRKPLLKARLAKKTGYILKTIYFRTQCQSYSNKRDKRQSQMYLCVRELILYVLYSCLFPLKEEGKLTIGIYWSAAGFPANTIFRRPRNITQSLFPIFENIVEGASLKILCILKF